MIFDKDERKCNSESIDFYRWCLTTGRSHGKKKNVDTNLTLFTKIGNSNWIIDLTVESKNFKFLVDNRQI